MFKKIVIVLGMHRSGTSALTAGLNALGFAFGHNDSHKSIENPKGYFENQLLVQLNDRILKHLGYTWSNPFLPYAIDVHEIPSEFREEAAEILSNCYGDQTCWGMKDPRVCILLPFWNEVIKATFENSEIYYIHALRSPLEVAESLKVRKEKFNQFHCGNTEQSLLLWFTHHYGALSGAEKGKNIIVTFADLIDNPKDQVKRLARFLGKDANSADILDYCNSFLDKSLKHHSAPKSHPFLENSEFRFVGCLYASLLSLKDKASFGAKEVESVLSHIPDLELYYACRKIGAPLFQSEVNQLALQDEIHALKKENNDLAAKFSHVQSQFSIAREKLDAQKAQVEELRGVATSMVEKQAQSIEENKRLREKLIDKSTNAEVNKAKVPRSFLKIKSRIFKKKHRSLILKSSLFDEKYYSEHCPEIPGDWKDPLDHFLHVGWKRGCKPNSQFDPLFYLLAYPDVAASGMNPLVHYILSGKKEGRKTSENSNESFSEKQANHIVTKDVFDPDFYRLAYPDTHHLDPYYHYCRYGQGEGRLPTAAYPLEFAGLESLDSSKETVLVVSHDASRTGGPLLTIQIIRQLKKRFNTVALVLHDGPLSGEFKNVSDATVIPPINSNIFLLSAVIRQLCGRTPVRFAIANSIESRYALPALAKSYVPSLCLVHEFAAYIRPASAFVDAKFWASQVVYSADIVYRNVVEHCPDLFESKPVILPQGRTAQPSLHESEVLRSEARQVENIIRPNKGDDDAIVILSIGTVELRKGVDLFISVAARLLAILPDTPLRFVWVGKGFEPESDTSYSAYLSDQIERYNLENHFIFTGELTNISTAYEVSDIFFLSSRLDPLPNSAIDAMFCQLPVVCFNETSGIGEIMKSNLLLSDCVVPYLSIEDAAQCCKKLIVDKNYRRDVGLEVQKLANERFDMSSYVSSLIGISEEQHTTQQREKFESQLIVAHQAIDTPFYCQEGLACEKTLTECAVHFVKSWKNGNGTRKPFPGFHPGIYLEKCDSNVPGMGNPLAHYLKHGKPEGPWATEILFPGQVNGDLEDLVPLQGVALHIHVYYFELFDEIFKRIEKQNLVADLFISTTSRETAEKLSKKTALYQGGSVEIIVVPNTGRDIGSFLTGFGEQLLENYEIIGHLHTKKSADVKDPGVGRRWFEFLLENLLGSKHDMARLILGKMNSDSNIGLVFPEDPYIVGWGKNKSIAVEFARNFDISQLPGTHLNFPVGTMFWARTAAIEPLFRLGLTWSSYPKEPIPYDGTLLHAIERLFPSIVEVKGYRYVMTAVPGVTR